MESFDCFGAKIRKRCLGNLETCKNRSSKGEILLTDICEQERTHRAPRGQWLQDYGTVKSTRVVKPKGVNPPPCLLPIFLGSLRAADTVHPYTSRLRYVKLNLSELRESPRQHIETNV